RILDGEKAYVDILETTPPIPMLVYMPSVFLARWSGLSAEAMNTALTYGSAVLALTMSAVILPEPITKDGVPKWCVLLTAAVILFVLPVDVFAEREYFAAAFALPLASVFVRHAVQGTWGPLWERVVAGVLAALTIAIKPPLFVAPGLTLALYYWFHTGSL